jgi:hypothetical protein
MNERVVSSVSSPQSCTTASVLRLPVEGVCFTALYSKCLLRPVAVASGTNGYVIRNLSVLRSRDTQNDRANAWDAAPPKHREPDKEILEHERKRKVEVKCLELQLELEDKG